MRPPSSARPSTRWSARRRICWIASARASPTRSRPRPASWPTVAAQVTGSAVEVASLGEAFGVAVQLFSESNDKLVAHLQRIEGALGQVARAQRRAAGLLRGAGARSHRPEHDVAEADRRRPAAARQPARACRSSEASMSEDDIDGGVEPTAPVWAVFGDLMSGLLGAFVLILVCVIGMQLELATKLEAEVKQRQVEAQRRKTLEQALAGPLAAGRVTLDNGRIGISGSVLFALQLRRAAARRPATAEEPGRAAGRLPAGARRDPDGERLHRRPAGARAATASFADNWELSAQRALTVTRALIEEGMPSSSVFAAAFGSEQPVGSNADAEGRARNRRVEMAPVPKPSTATATATASARPRE